MASEAVSGAHLRLTNDDIERRRSFVGLEQADIERVRSLKSVIADHAEEHTKAFFDYLANIGEAAPLFRHRDILEKARQLKLAHLSAMVEGDYGTAYVEERIKLGALYARVQLDHSIFLGAFHHLIRSIGKSIVQHLDGTPDGKFETFMSFHKVAFFDVGIIMDTLVAERERTIVQQQDAIRELSTPVLQLRDRLLILPIIGLIDSFRAKQLTDGLLQAIRANRAKVVVLDVTGVGTVDSKVANHLIQTAAAARLMGAHVIITGVSAEIAQTLVTLGVDLGRLRTVGDLQGGLEEAERLLGYKMVPARQMALDGMVE